MNKLEKQLLVTGSVISLCLSVVFYQLKEIYHLKKILKCIENNFHISEILESLINKDISIMKYFRKQGKNYKSKQIMLTGIIQSKTPIESEKAKG